MQEIHNGSTQTLQITILKNGVESAADGAVSVSIYDVSINNNHESLIFYLNREIDKCTCK